MDPLLCCRYLRAFGKQYDSKLMYLTDVGTTADQHCVPRLAKFMDRNPDYVAVTGFQRVQVCISTAEAGKLLSAILLKGEGVNEY